MTSFEHIFLTLTPVRDTILEYLSASDAAALAAAYGYDLTEREKIKYLNPIRDMPEYQDWILEMIATGHTVTLCGNDVEDLVQRINDPLAFYRTASTDHELCIWVAVIPAFMAVNYRGPLEHMDQLHMEFVRLPESQGDCWGWAAARRENEHRLKLIDFRQTGITFRLKGSVYGMGSVITVDGSQAPESRLIRLDRTCKAPYMSYVNLHGTPREEHTAIIGALTSGKPVCETNQSKLHLGIDVEVDFRGESVVWCAWIPVTIVNLA